MNFTGAKRSRRLGLRRTCAIPHLVQAAKTDASGVVVNQAIVVLGSFRHRAAVEGLIESL